MTKRQHKGAISSARLATLRQKLEKGKITEKEYKLARQKIAAKKIKISKTMIKINVTGGRGTGKTIIGNKIIECLQKEYNEVKWLDEDNHVIGVTKNV